jgi:hypothetical protein
MATKLTAVDYTDAELLALCKQAIAELTVFSSSTFRGKTVTRANLSELLKLRDDLERRIRKQSVVTTTVLSRHART